MKNPVENGIGLASNLCNGDWFASKNWASPSLLQILLHHRRVGG